MDVTDIPILFGPCCISAGVALIGLLLSVCLPASWSVGIIARKSLLNPAYASLCGQYAQKVQRRLSHRR